MAQEYIDNETRERFSVFFEGKDEADLKEQMTALEGRLEGCATLECEATGETLEEAREALRQKFKEELCGDVKP